MTSEARLPQLCMRRPDLRILPALTMPAGYSLRSGRPGDEQNWCRIIGEAFDCEKSMEDWQTHMIRKEGFAWKRIFFVSGPDDFPVATASGFRHVGHRHGYLHYVGVTLGYRGRGLGRAVSLAAIRLCAQEGCVDCTLHTDDHRIPAIRMYLGLGFAPHLTHPSHEDIWHRIRRVLEGHAGGGRSC